VRPIQRDFAPLPPSAGGTGFAFPATRLNQTAAELRRLSEFRRRLIRVGRSPRFQPSTQEFVMNWDQVKGNWKQMKGKVQQQWGKLTDDDLDRIDGKREELAGRIQERYGYEKEQADKEIERFCGTC
jgi:uncharacterized protein YjbJ (UPF0337 family)